MPLSVSLRSGLASGGRARSSRSRTRTCAFTASTSGLLSLGITTRNGGVAGSTVWKLFSPVVCEQVVHAVHLLAPIIMIKRGLMR